MARNETQKLLDRIVTPLAYMLNNRILLSVAVSALTLIGGSAVFLTNLPDKLATIEADQVTMQEVLEIGHDLDCYMIRSIRLLHPETTAIEPLPESCKL